MQDKIRMRERLGALGVPDPRVDLVAEAADLVEFGDAHGWPVVVKTATGGYDGKGVWFPADADEAAELLGKLAWSGLRRAAGSVRPRAVGHGRSLGHRRDAGVAGRRDRADRRHLHRGLAPAPGLDARLEAEAQTIANTIAEDLDVVGVMAVELFQTRGRLLVNELAMRPHNSGHWSIDGARTSQFEQHLRAVLGWPLGDTAATGRVVVMANLLGGTGPDAADLAARLPLALALDPGAHVHLYGKGVRAGRKIGHVTVVGDDVADTRRRARAVADLLRGDRS